jgi:hypothetical protein
MPKDFMFNQEAVTKWEGGRGTTQADCEQVKMARSAVEV